MAFEGLLACVLSEMASDVASLVEELVAVGEDATVLLHLSLLDLVEVNDDFVLLCEIGLQISLFIW